MTSNSQTASPPQRPKKPKPPNAIEVALKTWFATCSTSSLGSHDVPALTAQAPKRWVVYHPMVLLPAGSFDSAPWQSVFRIAPEPQVQDLWKSILNTISRLSKEKLTHLAINEGIPLHESDSEENILRSPSGLRVLHGDFGPAKFSDAEQGATVEDFEKAFWVSTKQNGIYQTWAPRWTMFSRGNVKEKARLLDFHSNPPVAAVEQRLLEKKGLEDVWAVDLYAGIGYFVFSYAKLGMRILCWELNPWSVEGLRMGALGNGWKVRVVQGAELSSISMKDVLQGEEQIIVFLESNEMASTRMAQLDREDRPQVRHVNGGFLPTSEPVWEDANDLARGCDKAWLHLHENVGIHDIEGRKGEIQNMFDKMIRDEKGRQATVEHVELVKTFAPGVWHCVFDVYITSYATNT